MRDEIEMRLMDEHRAALATWISGVIVAVGDALRRVHALQFDAPWRDGANRCS
jgi:hypothetical protein